MTDQDPIPPPDKQPKVREHARLLLNIVLSEGLPDHVETFHAADHAYIGEGEYYVVSVERRKLMPSAMDELFDEMPAYAGA